MAQAIKTGLPVAISKERAKEIEATVSGTYELLSELCRELNEHGEFDLLATAKRTAGSVWSLRKKVQTRALTAKPVVEILITGWQNTLPNEWTVADSTIADAEGWNLFNAGTDACDLEKDDEAAIFANDDDATTHVLTRARAGSALHQKALDIWKAQNRMGFAAAMQVMEEPTNA